MGPSTVASADGMTLDPAAFDVHLRPHLPVMHRLASRLAPAAADDVLQEAVLRAWQRWDTYRPDRGSLRSWLLAITVNEARRHGAQRGRALRLFERLTSEQRVLAGRSPQAPSTIPLEQALDRLSPRQRPVIDLHYYVDLPVREVAAVLGISEGTVKSTLSDARHRLRAMIGNGG